MLGIERKLWHLKERPNRVDTFGMDRDGLGEIRNSQIDILVTDYGCVSDTCCEFLKLRNVKRPKGCCEVVNSLIWKMDSHVLSLVSKVRTDA
jgi:hypothetical protein